MKKLLALLLCSLLIVSAVAPATYAAPKNMNVNVVLNQELTPAIEKQLTSFGKINSTIPEINALTMKISADRLPALLALNFVEAANEDALRSIGPETKIAASTIADNGRSTWNLDAINVTDPGKGRVVEQSGDGVYVAVLDTGLIKQWREFFPADSILTQYAKSFGGGGSDSAAISEQPNKWESDVNSHGTHVTSTILGYTLNGTPINGVAPMAKIIPVKVLNQNGSGSSYVISRAIVYIADLKVDELGNAPVVINMSLGGGALDAVEKAAIEYAVDRGVVIVAAAGNEGMSGMGYPAAYEPVISVAASGWTKEWTASGWWTGDVADPTNPEEFYITDFSSRDLVDSDDPVINHDLDVAAPGSWIVGPYAINQGKYGYYYLGGTSMACPHVAGAVALLLEKSAGLGAKEVENLLETTAIELLPGSRTIYNSAGVASTVSWGLNATGHGLMDVQALLNAIQ